MKKTFSVLMIFTTLLLASCKQDLSIDESALTTANSVQISKDADFIKLTNLLTNASSKFVRQYLLDKDKVIKNRLTFLINNPDKIDAEEASALLGFESLASYNSYKNERTALIKKLRNQYTDFNNSFRDARKMVKDDNLIKLRIEYDCYDMAEMSMDICTLNHEASSYEWLNEMICAYLYMNNIDTCGATGG